MKAPQRPRLIHLLATREDTHCGRGKTWFTTRDVPSVTCPRCLAIHRRQSVLLGAPSMLPRRTLSTAPVDWLERELRGAARAAFVKVSMLAALDLIAFALTEEVVDRRAVKMICDGAKELLEQKEG